VELQTEVPSITCNAYNPKFNRNAFSGFVDGMH